MVVPPTFLRSSVPCFLADLFSLPANGVVFLLTFLLSSLLYFPADLFSLPTLGVVFPLTFLRSSVPYFPADLYSLLGIALLLTVLDFLVFVLSSLRRFFFFTSLILIAVNALSSFSDQSFPSYGVSSFHFAEL